MELLYFVFTDFNEFAYGIIFTDFRTEKILGVSFSGNGEGNRREGTGT